MALTDAELENRNRKATSAFLVGQSRPYPVKITGNGNPTLFVPTKAEQSAKVMRAANAMANNNQADPFRNETSGMLRAAINPSGRDISDTEYEQQVRKLSSADKPAAPITPTTPQPTPQAPIAAPLTREQRAQQFATEQTDLGRQDLNVPGQQASGTYRGITSAAPRPGSAPGNDVIAFQNNRAQNYKDAQDAMIKAEDARRLSGGRVNNTAEAAQRLQAAEAANNAASGPLERVTYARQNGFASGIREAGANRGGGLSGADTDAEASRNLQARMEQDAAASQMAASLNRGAEAERDTRAARLGISRGTLDAMEGRGGAGASATGGVIGASPTTVWDRPGDNFGDAQMRENRYNSLLSDADRIASNPGNRTRKQAAQAIAGKLDMARAFMEPGTTAVAAQTAQQKTLAEQQAAAQNAQADWEKARMQEAGLDRRARLTQEGQLANTELGKRWDATRDAASQQTTVDVETAKQAMEQKKEANAFLTSAYSPQGKNPPMTTPSQVNEVLGLLDPAKLQAAGAGDLKDLARWRSGDFNSVAEVQKVLAIVKDYQASKPAWWKVWGSPADPNALLAGQAAGAQ